MSIFRSKNPRSKGPAVLSPNSSTTDRCEIPMAIRCLEFWVFGFLGIWQVFERIFEAVFAALESGLLPLARPWRVFPWELNLASPSSKSYASSCRCRPVQQANFGKHRKQVNRATRRDDSECAQRPMALRLLEIAPSDVN